MGLLSRTLLFLLIAFFLAMGVSDTPRTESADFPRSDSPGESDSRRLCVNGVDPLGQAIEGVSVRLYRELSDRRFATAGELHPRPGATCLERVGFGTLWVLAEAPGRARASARVFAPHQQNITLVLAVAAKLTVRVTDELSGPLEGATVLIRSTSDPLPYGKLTGRDGSVQFARLPAGPWSLFAAAPGYQSTTRTEVSGDSTVQLRRLASLDVRVVDSAGEPVAAAGVVIAGSTLWPARRAVTDAQGLARIRGLDEGSYDLRATAGTQISAPLQGFELARGASETLTLRLQPGRMVTAVVVDGGAGPSPPGVPGADVVLVEDGIGSFPLHGRTGADGQVTLGPIARRGQATLAARAADFTGGPLVSVPDPAPQPVLIPLLRGAVLRGEVVDAGGHPIRDAQVEIVGTDRFGSPIAETPLSAGFRAFHFAWSLSGPPALIPSGELGVMPGPVPPIPRPGMLPPGPTLGDLPNVDIAPWTTRPNGEFVAKPVSPGRIRAMVRHPEFVEGASELVTLLPGGEERVRIVLSQGGRLEGRVVDDRGYPVGDARVGLIALRGTFEQSTLTAGDGSFAFAAVPREVTLWGARPDRPDRVVVRRSLSIPDGERSETELVIPAPRDAVSVVVVDDRGQPVDLAEVRFVSLDPAVSLRMTVFTDASGSVELGDARGLSLRISANAPGFAPVTQDFSSTPSRVPLALDAGVLVHGRVTAVRARRAAANAVVTLLAGTERKSTMTNAEGAFRFSGVTTGRAEVAVSHPDFADIRLEVEIGRTGRSDRPFELAPIDLSEAGQIEGRILDAEDRPVEGARVAVGAAPVYLPQGALPSAIVLTDHAGRFVLGRLSAGSVRVEGYLAGRGRGHVDSVVVEAGRTTEGVEIRLREPDSKFEPLATGGVAITLGERAGDLVVVQVAERSEAERGGLRVSDVLERIDGVRPTSIDDARVRLAGPAGSDLLVHALRGGSTLSLRITREPIRR